MLRYDGTVAQPLGDLSLPSAEWSPRCHADGGMGSSRGRAVLIEGSGSGGNNQYWGAGTEIFDPNTLEWTEGPRQQIHP